MIQHQGRHCILMRNDEQRKLHKSWTAAREHSAQIQVSYMMYDNIAHRSQKFTTQSTRMNNKQSIYLSFMVATLFLFLSNTSRAENWILASQNESMRMLIDTDSIKAKDSTRYAWTLSAFGRRGFEDKTYYAVDCLKLALKEIITEMNISGFRHSTPGDNTWIAVTPSDPNLTPFNVVDFVCKWPTPAS